MKQMFLSAVLTAVCLFGLVATASAQSQSQSYKGTLSNVTMNGKHFDNVNEVIFKLEKQDNGNYILSSAQDIGPIGKMPGSISVKVPVTVTNGVITPVSVNTPAGKLKLKIGGSVTLKLKSLTGTVTDETVNFVLDTYAGWESLPIFPASVTFSGSRLH